MFLLPNISSLCVYIYIYLLRGELQSSEEYTQIHYTTNALSLGVIHDFLKSPTPTNSLAKPRIHHSGKKMSLHMHPGFALISLNWTKLCMITGIYSPETVFPACAVGRRVCAMKSLAKHRQGKTKSCF